MAKTESTAVNALIALPLRPPADVDLFAQAKPARAEVPSLPRGRAARGTTPARIAEVPSLPRVRAAEGTPAPVVVAPQPKVAEIYNATAKVAMIAPRSALWYAVPLVIVVSIATSLIMRSQLARPAAPVATSPVVAVVTAPVVTPAVAVPIVAPATAPIVAPIVVPVVTTPPIIDVRFDSLPAGATVTLIDHGRPRFLGTTPVVVGVDSSSEVEVVFTGAGLQTQLAHFDPRATQHVSSTLPAEPAAMAPPPPHAKRVVRPVARKHR